MVVRYSKKSLKFLSKLDSKSVARIKAAVDGLKMDPPRGDIKVMQGYSDGRYRLRVGDWRILYRYVAEEKIEVLFIIEIGNRGDIYK